MRHTPAILLTTVGLLALAGPATAESPAQTSKKDSSSESSETPLQFEVDEQGPRQPWSMSITNQGTRPVQLVADPRLLWFEVKVPGKRKTQTCRLPDTLFPARENKKLSVVLEPDEGVFHSFDPRLYCFASAGQWRLVPGAFVTPHFGWPEKTKKKWKKGKLVKVKTKQKAPFVSRVIEAAPEGVSRLPGDQGDEPEAEGAATKELGADSFALPSTYAAWSRTRLDDPAREKERGPFELKLTRGSDAHAERTATIRLGIHNRSKRTHHLFIRRELVSFEVMGPDGLLSCDPEPDLRAPDRQAFFRMRPGRTVTITSRLVELCPRGTFAQPGLYLVHARMDPNQTGEEFDLDAFVGRIVSEEPVSVRIRTGEYRQMKKQRRMQRVATGKPSP